jgi:acetyl esterase/lipase
MENDSDLSENSFEVVTERNVVYAQGLSHQSWNSDIRTTVDLELDLYLPENEETNRPLMVYIHGGAFRVGDKSTPVARGFSEYFAERGFVAASINYRLESDFGTLPEEFNNAVDARLLLSDSDRNQIKAIYPSTRDAKAALRWLVANADIYGIDTDKISVIGGSAGSYIAIALGATEASDYTEEIQPELDPTLNATYLDVVPEVKAVVNHWGGPAIVNLMNEVYQLDRWDAEDSPLSIVHGTEDRTVNYSEAEELVQIYSETGAYYELNTLEGAGHSAWDETIEGLSLEAASFDFISRMLNL